MALAVLFVEAFGPEGAALISIDHGLRPEACEDLAAVEALAARLSCRFVGHRLTRAPTGSVQAWARSARYSALSEIAARHRLAAIVTAHTLDDQAETLLLRLGRKSGVRGLAGMRPRAYHHGTLITRPLLGVRREALREALRARGMVWRDDPSNDDLRFSRTKVRAVLPALESAGVSAEAIAGSAALLAAADDTFCRDIAAWWEEWVRMCPSGSVRIDRGAFGEARHDVRRQALAAAVKYCGGRQYEPRARLSSQMEHDLLSGTPTQGGRTRALFDGNDILIVREPRTTPAMALPPGAPVVFDGRFVATAAHGAPALSVRLAGSECAARVPRVAHKAVIAGAPAVCAAQGGIIAFPTLGVWRRGVDKNLVEFVKMPDPIGRGAGRADGLAPRDTS